MTTRAPLRLVRMNGTYRPAYRVARKGERRIPRTFGERLDAWCYRHRIGARLLAALAILLLAVAFAYFYAWMFGWLPILKVWR